MWAASCLATCCASCACEACRSVAGGITRRSARIAYCGLFALSLIVAWILREVAAPLMEKIPWINHFAHTPSKEWFQTDAVLRVSLGNFLFFTLFALLMIGVKDQRDTRDSWHHGGWMAKIIAWCTLIVLMFFIPNSVVGFYESLAKFGSGLFLLVQVVLLLDFTHTWNDAWVAKDEQFWYIALFVVSLVCYTATFSFSGLLFHWFKPSNYDCSLNTFSIVITSVLVFVFAMVALHPKVNGSLLPTTIQREQAHISTPSTTIHENLKAEAVHLLALKEIQESFDWANDVSVAYGFVFVDVAACQFFVGSISDDSSRSTLGTFLMQVSPHEQLFELEGLYKETQKALKKHISS